MTNSFAILTLCVLPGIVLLGCTLIWAVVRSLYDEEVSPMDKILRRVKNGRCPQCDELHPESIQHEGKNDFWMSFECPNCGYKIKAHLNNKDLPNR